MTWLIETARNHLNRKPSDERRRILIAEGIPSETVDSPERLANWIKVETLNGFVRRGAHWKPRARRCIGGRHEACPEMHLPKLYTTPSVRFWRIGSPRGPIRYRSRDEAMAAWNEQCRAEGLLPDYGDALAESMRLADRMTAEALARHFNWWVVADVLGWNHDAPHYMMADAIMERHPEMADVVMAQWNREAAK